MTALCLTMIVKNEEHVIARALRSARPHISSWCICDTGSTDDTISIVEREMASIPGQAHRIPWEGFGPARTRAFDLARGMSEYCLVLDADEILQVDGEVGLLAEACYGLWVEMPTCKARSHRIFRSELGWRYESVIHEYPMTDAAALADVFLDHVSIASPFDGARSRNPRKYLDDAMLVGEALVEDPSNSRLVFNLACSWRDARDDERAVRHFLQRAAMGDVGNPEEVYLGYLEAGRAFCRLRRPVDAEKALLEARRVWPERGEAMAVLGELYAAWASVTPPCGTTCVESIHYKGPVQ